MQAIEHKGIIRSITGNKAEVVIVNESACAGCHAKGACSMSDMKEKTIEIPLLETNGFSSGEQVIIMGRNGMGFKALFLAYILPFLLVMAALITGTATGRGELMSGIISIGILIPYYILLSFFNKSLKKQLTFTIEKIYI